MRKSIVILLFLVIVGTAIAFVAARDDPNAKPTASEVYRRVLSPSCPGLTLDECSSSSAAALRVRIAELVSEKKTNAQIDAWLSANYGPQVFGKPRSPWVWAPSVLVVIVGVILLAMRAAGSDEAQQRGMISSTRAQQTFDAYVQGNTAVDPRLITVFKSLQDLSRDFEEDKISTHELADAREDRLAEATAVLQEIDRETQRERRIEEEIRAARDRLSGAQ